MNNYASGRRYEHEVKQMFEANGYNVVRAASSKSPFDLVAVKITQRAKKTTYFLVLCQEKYHGTVQK